MMALFGFLKGKEKTIEQTYTSSSKGMKQTENGSLNEEQDRVFQLLENSSENFFVTGRAGTGKSFLLRYFVEHSSKKCVVVAPTGIAAINAGGETIHSFFCLDTHAQNPANSEQMDLSENLKMMLSSFQVLIIDEVSMVRSDIMDMIDAKLKKARNNQMPFGGCQIIAFGDLYQLPPFCGDSEIQKYIYDKHFSEFFFAAPVFKQHPLRIIELVQVQRQKDDMFKDLLNRVRVGENTTDILEKLNARCIEPSSDIQYITLVPSNEAAQIINRQMLSKLPGQEYLFRGEVSGQFSQKEAPTDINLTLKVGASIIMLKNDPAGRWHNGSMGIVESVEAPEFIRIRITDIADSSKGYLYEVSRETWQKYQYKYDKTKRSVEQEQIGSFTQFPLRLAYAITIHKSQGQTYEKVKLDYSRGRAFAAGQTYVALSRCKSLDGLYLSKPLLSSDIKVNSEVVRFLSGSKESKELIFSGTASGSDTKSNSESVSIEWLPDQRIKVPVIENPKKVTGTRFAAILDADSYNSPFAAWCAIMRVYEKPFEENQYTITGKVVEPKQYSFVASKLKNSFRIVSPDECFGEGAKENMGFNFFEDDNEVFGGMWDYLLQKDHQRHAVFEMKTTNIKNMQKWKSAIPENVRLQAALYAYLLQVDEFYIVVSFIHNEDYEKPEKYVCCEENTYIKRFRLSKDFADFEMKYIQRVLQWWEKHVETGISPQYDTYRDREVLSALRSEIAARK